MFMLLNEVKPSDITVLAAYQGQVTLIRKEFKRLAQIYPKLFEDEEIPTRTIDMFQGDENKYLIVSLVRSNLEESIGFLADRNRRCVAQSRAQCGMYFVGDMETLSKKGSPWTLLIQGMAEEVCVSLSPELWVFDHIIHETMEQGVLRNTIDG